MPVCCMQFSNFLITYFADIELIWPRTENYDFRHPPPPPPPTKIVIPFFREEQNNKQTKSFMGWALNAILYSAL